MIVGVLIGIQIAFGCNDEPVQLFMPLVGWAVVPYFILVKLVVGILSAIAVLLSVVLPIVVFASSGRFPCPLSSETYQKNPIVYASWMTVLWALGVFGVMVVPALSVSLIAWVCVKNEYDQQQQQRVQEEQEGQEAAQMRESEGTVASLVDLEGVKVAAPLPSQTTAM
ncbi:hypothetical protein BBJ28_00009275 [Nothophytophthora sp. Chile5]|nr:hypothetical protein BBJ28_00009275 [Nothophytophthora sp. Chile5]